jgi:hypothetical protein
MIGESLSKALLQDTTLDPDGLAPGESDRFIERIDSRCGAGRASGERRADCASRPGESTVYAEQGRGLLDECFSRSDRIAFTANENGTDPPLRLPARANTSSRGSSRATSISRASRYFCSACSAIPARRRSSRCTSSGTFLAPVLSSTPVALRLRIPNGRGQEPNAIAPRTTRRKRRQPRLAPRGPE